MKRSRWICWIATAYFCGLVLAPVTGYGCENIENEGGLRTLGTMVGTLTRN